MSIASLLVVLALTSAPPPSTNAAGSPPMIPGKWQITYHTLTPFDLPPMVSVVCVEKSFTDRVGIPPVAKNADCQVVTPAFDGRDLSYGLKCTKDGVSSQLKMRYLGDSFSGDFTVTNGDTVATQHIDAVRLGGCDEK